MNLTSHTKQLIVLTMGIVTFIVALGWGFGDIETRDALLVILPLFTGFFGLLKGEE